MTGLRRRLRAARERAERDGRTLDAGLTLAELLVVIGLFSILTTMIASIAILATRSVDGISTRLDNSTSSEVAIANISKSLRTAVLPGQLATSCATCGDNAVVAATSTKITFYANLNNTGSGPTKTTLEVVQDPTTTSATGMLRVTTQAPAVAADGSYSYCTVGAAGCAAAVRTAARGLLWPSPAVFTYLDFDGGPIAGTTVPAADLPRISSIDVQVQVRSKTGARYATAVAVQRVRLPNAEINARESTT